MLGGVTRLTLAVTVIVVEMEQDIDLTIPVLMAIFLPRSSQFVPGFTSLNWYHLSPSPVLVYACLDTCCKHFLTIIAGADLNFRHESDLPVCRTRGLNPGRRGARRGC